MPPVLPPSTEVKHPADGRRVQGRRPFSAAPTSPQRKQEPPQPAVVALVRPRSTATRSRIPPPLAPTDGVPPRRPSLVVCEPARRILHIPARRGSIRSPGTGVRDTSAAVAVATAVADDALAGSPTKAASAWQRATPAAPHPDSEEGRRRMESLATLTPQEDAAARAAWAEAPLLSDVWGVCAALRAAGRAFTKGDVVEMLSAARAGAPPALCGAAADGVVVPPVTLSEFAQLLAWAKLASRVVVDPKAADATRAATFAAIAPPTSATPRHTATALEAAAAAPLAAAVAAATDPAHFLESARGVHVPADAVVAAAAAAGADARPVTTAGLVRGGAVTWGEVCAALSGPDAADEWGDDVAEEDGGGAGGRRGVGAAFESALQAEWGGSTLADFPRPGDMYVDCDGAASDASGAAADASATGVVASPGRVRSSSFASASFGAELRRGSIASDGAGSSWMGTGGDPRVARCVRKVARVRARIDAAIRAFGGGEEERAERTAAAAQWRAQLLRSIRPPGSSRPSSSLNGRR